MPGSIGAYPFILVDKVLAASPGEKAVGLKNVTANDPLVAASGEGGLVLRRGLLLEAFVDLVSAALGGKRPAGSARPELEEVRSMRFLKTPEPGDQLVLTVTLREREGERLPVHCKAEAGGRVIAEGEVVLRAEG